jgi:hypothetical protein
MSFILLILETEHDIESYQFNSAAGLEEFLTTIKNKEYCYKNITFYTNNELNWHLSKIYRKRYLVEDSEEHKKYFFHLKNKKCI